MNNKIVVILLLLITAGIAFAAEDWNLAGISVFTGVNTTDLNVSRSITATNISAKNIGGVIYADQYATIQDAITASDPDNDGTADYVVYIPRGTYLITSAINLKNNSIIIGEERNSTILRADNFISSIFTFTWPNPLYLSDVSISGCTFDVNHESNVLGINLVGHNINIYDNIFTNSKDYKIVKIGHIENNIIDMVNKSTKVYFKNNIIKDATSVSSEIVYITNADNSIISGNIFENVSSSGLGTAVELRGQSNSAVISKNVFINSSVSRALHIIGTSGVVVRDNSFLGDYDGVDGVDIEASQNIELKILSNDFRHQSGNGMHVKIYDYECSDAEFKYCDTIYENSTNIIISDNTFTNGWYSINIGDYIHRYQTIDNVIITRNIINTLGTGADAGVLLIGTESSKQGRYRNYIINSNIFNGTNPSSGLGVIHIAGNGSTPSCNFTISDNHFELLRGNVAPGYPVYMNNVSGSQINNNMINNYVDGMSILSDTSNIKINQNYGDNPFNHGNSAAAPTPFGAGDTFYNSTANIQQLYTGSAWDWFLMPSKVFGTGVTNNDNGSITILPVLPQCPSSLINGSMCLNYTNGAQNNYFDGSWRYTNGTVI